MKQENYKINSEYQGQLEITDVTPVIYVISLFAEELIRLLNESTDNKIPFDPQNQMLEIKIVNA